MRCIAPKCKNRGGDLEDGEVEDDHDEDGAEDLGRPDYEVEARVEDETLASDHAPPSERCKGCVDIPWTRTDEPFKDDAKRVAHDAPGGDEQGPEVDCVAALEGREDFDVDEGCHVDGKGEHGDEDRGSRRVW